MNETINNEKLADLIVDSILEAPNVSVVYFIRCNEFVKIGVSRGSFTARLTTLQVGNPYELTLESFVLGGYPLEQRLHKHFRSKWISGEWYKLNKKEVEEISHKARQWIKQMTKLVNLLSRIKAGQKWAVEPVTLGPGFWKRSGNQVNQVIQKDENLVKV